jgi:hypothetical protein
VVHLVRRGSPLAGLDRFLASYRRHDAGAEHRLVLLLKGFETGAERGVVLDRLDGLAAECIDVTDEGFDLSAYRVAADRLDAEVACFLNSNSELLADGWLANLVSALQPGVGAAGATGSWNSARSNAAFQLYLPSPYGAVFPDRVWHRHQSRLLNDEIATSAGASGLAGAFSRPPLRYARTALAVTQALTLFLPFPAVHLRTNAFAIRLDTWRELRFHSIRSKVRAWQLESGRGSISEQLRARGLETLVVDRAGRTYRPKEWADSLTLWQADQENLLVADNQTEHYRLGDIERRTLLAKVAWGAKARPSAPSAGGPPAGGRDEAGRPGG